MQDNYDPNPAMIGDGEEFQILERTEARASGVPLFVSHWHIFVPTLVIGLLYSAAWGFLSMVGKSDSGLARLFIVVMAVGVPLLAAHAFLRYQTIRLQISEGQILCHPGWPRDLPICVPLNVIESVVVKRGLSGRLFGGGTVVLQLVTGGQVSVTDLAEPDLARSRILAAMDNRENTTSD